MDQQRHEMVLEKTHSSGAEDWYCPTCERRMSITWEPWRKIILEPGDMDAAHGGGKGGLRIGSLHVSQNNGTGMSSGVDESLQDPYLAPWKRWLDQSGSDDLWKRDVS